MESSWDPGSTMIGAELVEPVPDGDGAPGPLARGACSAPPGTRRCRVHQSAISDQGQQGDSPRGSPAAFGARP
eukprot:5464907-Alexandrium_andersonii.AAC.1